MLTAADNADKADVIKEWYDRYVFGDSYVYCPWDVVNYVSALKKRKVTDTIDNSAQKSMMEALWNGGEQEASMIISDLLWKTVSYNDYHEDYYHAFLAGIFVGLGYEVESNKEKGLGRPDILLKDDDNRRIIIIEAKRSGKEADLDKNCDEAISQIIEGKYAEGFYGYTRILCYGISFFQKQAKVKKMSDMVDWAQEGAYKAAGISREEVCGIKQEAENLERNKRTVAIGVQDFEQLVSRNCFYVDKTKFIKEWWENEDSVTLITRPRRFGKTLTLNMLERFFSIKYAGQGELFEGLDIWKEEKYRKLQGTCPVIGLTFAAVKQTNYSDVKQRICQIITDVYQDCCFVRDSEALTDVDRAYFDRISPDMQESDATYSLHKLSQFLSRYYGRKVLILLDEYDTPMQEAYVGGFWDEMVGFIRNLFNATFKTNPYLERAVLTGITRISKESIFSDLNNLEVISSTSEKYADVFGFTEKEVFAAMDEQGLPDKDMVKKWYDGFTFGRTRDIYNPWSIINYLDKRKLGAYWANTSSNSLVALQLKQAGAEVKKQFEALLQGEALEAEIDEEIVFGQLDREPDAIWSLLLASGYLKVLKVANSRTEEGQKRYTLGITNLEVRGMFGKLIRGWFAEVKSDYNAFVKALLLDDVEAMNDYMNEVTDEIFSSFDAGKKPSGKSQPERFYHGFVLGLLVELQGEYWLRSNRESGFGRYDVMLEPLDVSGVGIIIEFKVRRPEKEAGLEETVAAALRQIEEKHYERELLSRGVAPEKIRKYGFAFEGKKVLIAGRLHCSPDHADLAKH